jgi:hypothetical protein
MFEQHTSPEAAAAELARSFRTTPRPIGGGHLSPTEAVLRAVNDRIRELGGAWQYLPGFVDECGFICECANPGCLAIVMTPSPVYDDLCSTPRRFVLTPGHEQPGSETAVRSGGAYLVVARPQPPARPSSSAELAAA